MKIKTSNTTGFSLYKDAWQQLRHNRFACISGIWILLLALLAVLAPLIAPYSYAVQDLALRAVGPNSAHWLGTDVLGRDLLTRIIFGSRISLMVGLCATGVALLIGVCYGAVSGFLGGKIDSLMMRIVDIIYAFPFVIFVIILMVFFGRNIVLLFCAIGAIEWLTMARIVRAQIQSLKKLEFIEAAVTMGLTRRRILFVHMIPNIIGPIIIYATLTIPNVIILESFLSFLGLGVQPPMSSWGLLIKEGAEAMEECPWLLVFPGAILISALFAFNAIGDGLRDALDPWIAKD